MDLNDFPQLKEVVKETKQSTFGCCFESDPMHLINVLPKAGWIPGQTIPLTIEINNNSDVTVYCVKMVFWEKLFFYTKSPSDKRKVTNQLNSHVFSTPVAPYQNRLYQLSIQLDSSFDYKIFDGCGLMHVEYYIKTQAQVNGYHTNPENKTFITIGTVPFRDSLISYEPQILPPSAPYEFNATAPLDDVISEQPLPSYDDLTLPPQPEARSFGCNFSPKNKRAPLASTKKLNTNDDFDARKL